MSELNFSGRTGGEIGPVGADAGATEALAGSDGAFRPLAVEVGSAEDVVLGIHGALKDVSDRYRRPKDNAGADVEI